MNIPSKHPQFDNVSHETISKLRLYQEFLLKWQKKINLISPQTIKDAWERHFVDSMQVFDLIPSPKAHLVDLGSGAGFPGLVLAVMGVEKVTLIESDRRKCIFLKEVVRALELENVEVINKRLEEIVDIKADVITARALASLDQLLDWAKPFIKPDTVLIFPKGRRYEEEMAVCSNLSSAQIDIFDSLTDEEAKMIRLSGLSLN